MPGSMMAKLEKMAEYLRRKRLESGMTQTALSRVLGYKTSQFVSNWENGRSSLPLSALAQIIRVLDVPQSEIIEILMAETKEELTTQLSVSKVVRPRVRR